MDYDVMNRRPEYENLSDGRCAEYRLMCYADEIRKLLLMLADKINTSSNYAAESLKGDHDYESVIQWYIYNFSEALNDVDNISEKLDEIVDLYSHIEVK